jgi:hypothetical protein
MPYQVAKELHKNYSARIAQERINYKDTIEMVDNFKEQLKQKQQSKRQHPFISDNVFSALSNALDNLTEELKLSRDKRSEQLHIDPVFGQISQLFEGRVGEKPSDERVSEICKEGRERYKSQIPPGYSDDKDKPEPAKFGDLIIWLDTIACAKKYKKPIIFVTDDNKRDWWRSASSGKGALLGPSIELISEFLEKAKQRCWIYNSESFLKYAGPKFKGISESSVNEVREASKESRRAIQSSIETPLMLAIKKAQEQRTAAIDAAIQEKLKTAFTLSPIQLILENLRHDLDIKNYLQKPIVSLPSDEIGFTDIDSEPDEDQTPEAGE